jgi:hypothetical protein
MAVTIVSSAPVPPSGWLVTWSSDAAAPVTYYIYLNGVLADTTTATSKLFSVVEGENLRVEILDAAPGIADPAEHYPERAILAWYAPAPGSGSVDHYRVEESVASVWTLREKVRDDGRGYFTFESRVLEDVTTHNFRVIPVDAGGIQGSATSFALFMVRVPDPPDAAFAYSAGTGAVTITAA